MKSNLLIGGVIMCTILSVQVFTLLAVAWFGIAHGWGLALLVFAIAEANVFAAILVTLIFALPRPTLPRQTLRQQ
jgi:hypothetical protein